MAYINHNQMAGRVAENLQAHYGRLSASVARLSSGLRINSAADDAAGLACRELMRADIATFNQGVRNANDAISMIQVADGALGIIDEKLIRMKELAEQAATGTYNSTQRLMIDSEFQAMASEIDRIANATNFNGIRLLDGSRKGQHDGSKLDATGSLKVHFGPGNDSAEDYYYVEIGDCTLAGLGLREDASLTSSASNVISESYGNALALNKLPGATATGYAVKNGNSGIVVLGVIPKGSKNVTITLDGQPGPEDDLQIFTRDGTHLAGTRLTDDEWTTDATWWGNDLVSVAEAAKFMTEENGFLPGASYKLPGAAGSSVSGPFNDGDVANKTNATWGLNNLHTTAVNSDGKGSMNISYSGDYAWVAPNVNSDAIYKDDDPANSSPDDVTEHTREKLVIDEAADDLVIVLTGFVFYDLEANWDFMPELDGGGGAVDTITTPGDPIDIKTQEKGQKALTRLNDAIVKKDKVRAHLGALQNRLENTVANITVQAENLQAAESRISDADIALEMTGFIRSQILSQSAVAMLAQANNMPRVVMSLIG